MSWAAVDFGTTATCAATFDDGKRAVLVPQGTGTRLPSAVCVNSAGELIVGEHAARQGGYDLSRYEPTPKRLISHRHTSAPLGDDPVELSTIAGRIVGQALRPLAGSPPRQVMVTHPARWNGSQIDVLREGLKSAGYANSETLAEPVAAAWAVIPMDQRTIDARYAIFDWGGGTFDAAVVTWNGARFEVAGPPVGEDPLGGEDIDQLLYDHVVTIADPEDRAQLEPSTSAGRRARHQLRADVRSAKHQLSDLPSDRVQVGEGWVPITRSELNDLARPIVDRCVTALERCLREANVDHDQLAAVYLTGDSTRMPLVPERIRELAGIELPIDTDYDRKGAVALGALLAATAPKQAGKQSRKPAPDPKPAVPKPAARVSANPAKTPESATEKAAAPVKAAQAQTRPSKTPPATRPARSSQSMGTYTEEQYYAALRTLVGYRIELATDSPSRNYWTGVAVALDESDAPTEWGEHAEELRMLAHDAVEFDPQNWSDRLSPGQAAACRIIVAYDRGM